MTEVLCGLLLFGAGWLLGHSKRARAAPRGLTEQEQRAERAQREQWERLLSFSGRRNSDG